MVANNFEESFALQLKSEGENSNDPRDRGGRTSLGVIQATYDSYRRRLKQPTQIVYEITLPEAADIYHSTFWEPYCDRLPIGIDYMFFEFAANVGPHHALLELQLALGVIADGIFGPITAEAVEMAQPSRLAYVYSVRMIEYYKNIHNPTFINGWVNRTNNAYKAAIKMIGANK